MYLSMKVNKSVTTFFSYLYHHKIIPKVSSTVTKNLGYGFMRWDENKNIISDFIFLYNNIYFFWYNPDISALAILFAFCNSSVEQKPCNAPLWFICNILFFHSISMDWKAVNLFLVLLRNSISLCSCRT